MDSGFPTYERIRWQHSGREWRDSEMEVGDYISLYLGPYTKKTTESVDQMLDGFQILSRDLRQDGPRVNPPIITPKYPAEFPVPIPHPEAGDSSFSNVRNSTDSSSEADHQESDRMGRGNEEEQTVEE